MRTVTGFLFILFCIACENMAAYESEQHRPVKSVAMWGRKNPYRPIKMAEIDLIPKRILKTTGDFNGDGLSEWLTEYYFDTLTYQRIDSVSAEGLWSWQTYYETETWLIASDKRITPLKVP